jgi:hypothetical protein
MLVPCVRGRAWAGEERGGGKVGNAWGVRRKGESTRRGEGRGDQGG